MDVAKLNFLGGRRSPHRRLSPLWKTATTCLLLFLAPVAFAQSAKDPVIYPRGTAAGDAPAAAGKPETNSSFYLAVALLLGAGGWWLWLKRKGGVRGGLAGASHLTIAETKSLGSRQYLVVADYDGKKYLLGVCPGSIELLAPLEGGERKDA
jgi:flagellar protein FliO/FliZ